MKFIWGAAAIGKVIDQSPRAAFYMLERGLIPGRKVGDRWVSEEGALRAAIIGEDYQLSEIAPPSPSPIKGRGRPLNQPSVERLSMGRSKPPTA